MDCPPSALRTGGRPTAFSIAEHASAHDNSAGVARCFIDNFRITIDPAFGKALAFPLDLRLERPLMDPLATITQRVLDGIIRPGDKPIEGHRDMCSDVSHQILQSGS